MGLIPEEDRRPRDWAYKVAFDRKDLPSLQEMARHIRDSHDTDMIEDFNARCEQKLAGQSTVLDNGLEIEEVTKTGDLVVNGGLQQCINIILATNTNRWSTFGIAKNSGTNPPLVTNTTLDGSVDGPGFISIATYGWSEAKGMKLFFGTIGPQDLSIPFNANIVHEMGIAGTGGTPLLNRELFYNNPVSRTATPDGHMYKQVFIFSCVIEFCPTADVVSGIPMAPTGLVVNSIFAYGATLSCNIVNASPPVSSYKFYYSTSPTFSGGLVVNPSGPSVNIGSLTPETVYYVKCSAINSLGEGASSSTISFTTLAVLPTLLLHLDNDYTDSTGFNTIFNRIAAGNTAFAIPGVFGSHYAQLNRPSIPAPFTPDHFGAIDNINVQLDLTNGFSFSLWIKPSDITPTSGANSERVVVTKASSSSPSADKVNIGIDSTGRLFVDVMFSGTHYHKRDTVAISTSAFTHVVVTFNPGTSTLLLYKNKVSQTTVGSLTATQLGGYSNLTIGHDNFNGDLTTYEGAIDEVMYFKGIVLTQTQVNNLFTNNTA